MDSVFDLSVHISLQLHSDKDLYNKLDLIIQFLLKNHINGSVVLDKKDYQFDDSDGDC